MSSIKAVNQAAIFSPLKITFLTAILLLTIIALIIVGNNGIFELLDKASALNISILFVLFCGRWGLMLLRSQLLLQASGFKLRNRDTMAILWAYDFASESSPGGVGGPIVGLIFFKFFKVPTNTTASIALTGLVLDILSVAALLTIALMFTTLGEKAGLTTLVPMVFSMMACSLIGIWILIKYRRAILRMSSKNAFLKKFPFHSKARQLAKFWLRTGNAFQRLKTLTFKKFVLAFTSSLGVWACRLSMIYFIILTLSHNVSWPNAMLAQFIGGLTTMLIMVPGGFIGADISIGAVLLPFLDIKIIAGVILLWRLFTYHSTFILGGLSFLWISAKIRSENKSPLTPNMPSEKKWAQK